MAYKNYPYKIHRFNSLSSTQDKAKEFAEKGLSEIVVVADKQTKGRGRFGRKWHSGKNGLWMSILLKPKNAGNLQYLTFVAAIAVADSIKKIAGLNAKIKWPNDVHCKGKKLCGILTEAIFGKESYVILGIGLNLNQERFPEPIKKTASSLRKLTKKNFSRELFLDSICGIFFDLYKKYFNESRLDYILKLWKSHCDTLGREITAKSKTGTFRGKAVGLDNECRLILQLKNGTLIKIAEGDISVRY